MAKKQQPKNKSFGALLAVVAVVGVVILGYLGSRPTPVITLDAAAAASLAPGGIVIGSPDAPVEVIEFADFECPGCGYFATLHAPDIKARLVATGQMRFRFMDFPLDIHRNAVAAHNAAHCANAQDKFWLMHDMLFASQERWNSQAARDPKKVRKIMIELAESLDLDGKAFTACYDSGEMLPQIAANRREAQRLRIQSTPTFKIGNKVYPGSLTYDQMRLYVETEKARLDSAAAKPAAP
ncbi:MAG: DsbA family protein [Gemmatimonadota bacterium]